MNMLPNSTRLGAINVFVFVLLSTKLFEKVDISGQREYTSIHIYGQAPAVIKYFFFNV